MERVMMPALLLAVACSNNNPAGDGSQDRFDPYILDVWELEAPQEIRPDVFPDGTEDPGPDDSGQEIPICPDADSETVELVPIPPSRPAMDCGPNCRQVSFAESAVYDWHIDVEGNHLVFSTGRTGPTSNLRRVWLVDLETLVHYIIHEEDIETHQQPAVEYPCLNANTVNYLYSCLEVDGIQDRVVYHVESFDISNSRRTEIWQRLYERQDPCDFPLGVVQLECSSRYLAWWDGRVCTDWGGQAFLYDMETGEERLLSPDGCCASFVMMDGNWVVWEQGIPGNGIQIWIHDIERNESRPLTSGRLDKFSAYVLGDRVAWAECVVDGCTKYDGLSADIMMMDVVTGEVTPITSDIHGQGSPVIGENIIVWADCRNDPENSAECWNRKSDVYMKNLDSGEESRLTDVPNNALPAIIRGNKLYFLTRDLDDILSVFEITL